MPKSPRPLASVASLRVRMNREKRRARIAHRLGLPLTHPEVQRRVEVGAHLDRQMEVNAQTMAADLRRVLAHLAPVVRELGGWELPSFRAAALLARQAALDLRRAADELQPPRKKARSRSSGDLDEPRRF